LRWIKHLTSAHDDPSIVALMDEFGAEGYGIYWLLLEHVAQGMEKHSESVPTRTHLALDWATILCCSSARKLRKWVNRAHDLGLIRAETTLIPRSFRAHCAQDRLQIDIPKLLKYRDEWSKRSGVTREQATATATATATHTATAAADRKPPVVVAKISEYPETAKAIREKFDWTDDPMVNSIAAAAALAAVSLDAAALNGSMDDLIAAAVRQVWKSYQRGPALFLTTVPECVATWLTHGLPPGLRDDPENWVCMDCGSGPQCSCDGSPKSVRPEKALRRGKDGKAVGIHRIAG
jgi:hypothetical protein